jgi:hypothetical protein
MESDPIGLGGGINTRGGLWRNAGAPFSAMAAYGLG